MDLTKDQGKWRSIIRTMYISSPNGWHQRLKMNYSKIKLIKSNYRFQLHVSFTLSIYIGIPCILFFSLLNRADNAQKASYNQEKLNQ